MGNLLIKQGYIIALDSANNIFCGDILIKKDKIFKIAPHIEEKAEKTINASGKLVLPGFIHGHTHLCQTLFTPMFSKCRNNILDLEDSLDLITYYESRHTPETLYASARLGLAQLIKSGATGVNDMGTLHHQESIFCAIKESGIRAQAGKAMMDFTENLPTHLRESTEDSLKESIDLLHRWHGSADNRIRYAFAPRWQLWNTEGLLKEVRSEADHYQVGIHGHAGEGRNEASVMLRQRNRRNLTYLQSLGLVGPHVQMAHCIYLDEEEMQVIEDTGTNVIHCPVSNSVGGRGIARVPEMLARGISVALGSDGPISGNLNMFTEMRTAYYIHQRRLADSVTSSFLLPGQILRMATNGGAAALGLSNETGSLEQGKKADLIILDNGGLSAAPCVGFENEDPVTKLVLWYQSQSVQTVIIDGQIVMEDQILQTLDENQILEDAKKATQILMDHDTK